MSEIQSSNAGYYVGHFPSGITFSMDTRTGLFEIKNPKVRPWNNISNISGKKIGYTCRGNILCTVTDETIVKSLENGLLGALTKEMYVPYYIYDVSLEIQDILDTIFKLTGDDAWSGVLESSGTISHDPSNGDAPYTVRR